MFSLQQIMSMNSAQRDRWNEISITRRAAKEAREQKAREDEKLWIQLAVGAVGLVALFTYGFLMV